MHAVELVFGIGWAAFWIYWLAAAFSMKRGRMAWSRELRIRAVILVLVDSFCPPGGLSRGSTQC